MEAGEERLTRDAKRDATRQEIDEIKRENTELKHLVADLSLEAYRLKKQLFLPWRATTARAHEPWGEGYYPGPSGEPVQVQAPSAGGVGDTQEHLLPMATGGTRLGKRKEAVEPDYSRGREPDTGKSPRVHRTLQPATGSLAYR